MLNITTQTAIVNIRQYANREQVSIDFSDSAMIVRTGKKIFTIDYSDSLGSLVSKQQIETVTNFLRVRFQ